MALAALAPLTTVPGVVSSACSMARNPRRLDAPPAGMTLFDPMPAVTDFADTAAIIANLDLVISVDTSVVHHRRRLAKPVFLLDRYDHCWRWLSGRADSPWYPGLRIFRQPQHRRMGTRRCVQVHRTRWRISSRRYGPGRPGPIGIDLLKVPETVERDA